MSQIIPIYIPTYINSQDYSPARVLPRLFFYNGPVQCERYYIQDENGSPRQQFSFPYFDNYNVVSGQFPTSDSRTLLFNNEEAVYGTTPNDTLYTEYWETYINLLYNPKTRLLECNAIIPLADYVKMELNDVVNFRGNYYHLRAINDYSLKTGECNLQLLGPIIPDTFGRPDPPPPPIPNSTASIHLSEFNSGGVFLDANLIVAGTPYYFSGDFVQSVSGGLVADVTLQAAEDTAFNLWNGYSTASATLTIYNNGTLVTSSVNTYYSGSGSQYYTIPVTFTAGNNITISGSTTVVGSPVPPPPPAEYDFYTADVFPCNDCGGSTDTILVAFSGGTPITPGRFYLPQTGPDGNSYRIDSSTASGSGALILTNAFGSYTTCETACLV
jgi:hypothetical protein